MTKSSTVTINDGHHHYGGKMAKKGKILLFAGIAILTVAGFMVGFVWTTRLKPVNIDMDSPVAFEVKSAVKQMYFLEGNISCVPGTSVDVLADVMVDSSDYHATSYEQGQIEKVYGKQALTHAGLLTSKQAYYLSRDLPAPTISNPGSGPTPRPTATPVYLCSTNPETMIDELIGYVSIAQGQDGRVIVTYDYVGGRNEAITRLINGKWKVTSVKMIKRYGNG
jgi:hypothetical protein